MTNRPEDHGIPVAKERVDKRAADLKVGETLDLRWDLDWQISSIETGPSGDILIAVSPTPGWLALASGCPVDLPPAEPDDIFTVILCPHDDNSNRVTPTDSAPINDPRKKWREDFEAWETEREIVAQNDRGWEGSDDDAVALLRRAAELLD